MKQAKQIMLLAPGLCRAVVLVLTMVLKQAPTTTVNLERNGVFIERELCRSVHMCSCVLAVD